MKFTSVLMGALLCAGISTSAQTNFARSVSFAEPGFSTTPPVSFSSTPENFDASAPVPPALSAATPFAALAPVAPAPDPEPVPQSVQGVFEKYNYDVYVGFTFHRFYEVPGVQSNMYGVNASLVYWYRDWIGFDGEIFASYGSQPGQNSWYSFYGAGPRIRWVKPKGIDLWAHALIGISYITPQTPYGGQTALSGIVGVGADLNGHHRHMALRFAIDGVGTNYFGTFQISPKVSAGIVYKF
jgi:hypothetical protein